MSTKIFVLFALMCFVQVMAAPEPINWRKVGRRSWKITREALPVVKDGVEIYTLLNQQQPYYPYQQPPPPYYYGYPYPNPQGYQYGPPVHNYGY
ncbi:cecropin 2 precursor [Tribolium castaneum]|uniref:Antimicrobial peptide n=1 Tax=Tribolium castaneum TaxID=7070 RepID=D6W9Z0_TRICA|nr:cecropin 2 precursor [Tribolium castaneum]EEZ99429.1 antimicrobial peptide [Tribolium castaneum]|eukprot:NP_001164146.1 cecropin 2 precursor [Tribolium castaneum]